MQIGIEKSYEILCKAFDHEAKAILEVTVLVYESLVYLVAVSLCVHYHASLLTKLLSSWSDILKFVHASPLEIIKLFGQKFCKCIALFV